MGLHLVLCITKVPAKNFYCQLGKIMLIAMSYLANTSPAVRNWNTTEVSFMMNLSSPCVELIREDVKRLGLMRTSMLATSVWHEPTPNPLHCRPQH